MRDLSLSRPRPRAFAGRRSFCSRRLLHPAQTAISALLLVVLIAGGIGCQSGGSTSSIRHQIQAAATPAITSNDDTFFSSHPPVTITDRAPGASIPDPTDGSIPASA